MINFKHQHKQILSLFFDRVQAKWIQPYFLTLTVQSQSTLSVLEGRSPKGSHLAHKVGGKISTRNKTLQGSGTGFSVKQS